MRIIHLAGPFYEVVSDLEDQPEVQAAKTNVRNLISSTIGKDVADPLGPAHLSDLDRLRGGFYVRTDALLDPETTANIAKIGTALIARIISEIWDQLTSVRDVIWTIKNQLLADNRTAIDLELLGQVTNQTPHSYGSGRWATADDSPDLTIPYGEEMVLATISELGGAIGLVSYGFHMPGNNEGYCVITIYAAAPKHTRSGGNASIVYYTDKPQFNQEDFNKTFQTWDHSSARLPSVNQSFQHGDTEYTLNASFSGDHKVFTKIILSATPA